MPKVPRITSGRRGEKGLPPKSPLHARVAAVGRAQNMRATVTRVERYPVFMLF